jgi:hypothetical protein
MSELDTLAGAEEKDGVISDHVTTTHSVDGDLGVRSRAHVTVPTVQLDRARTHFPHGVGQALGRSAR